jgi:hypothetical protein
MAHLDAANPLNWPAGVLTTGSKNLNLVRMEVVMRQKFFIFFFFLISKTAVRHLNGTICV